MDPKEKLIDSISDYDQRVFIKFCTLLGYSAGVTEDHLKKAIGKNALKKKSIEKWQTKFRKGEVSIEERRGSTSPYSIDREERIWRIKEILEETKNISVRQIAERLDIPKSTTHEIIKDDLKLTKRLGRFVPHDLSPDQREHRILACQTNLELYKKTKEKLKRTLALDETWVGLYMQPQKDQMMSWLEPNELGPSIPLESRYGEKRMLLVAMDYNGIAWYHLLKKKESMTSELYKTILNEKIPKWLRGKPFRRPVLLHDNARPHKSKFVQDFLREKDIDQWHHPPYSPDISPCDYDCFGPLKRALRGVHYDNWDHFNTKLQEAIREGTQNGLYQGVRRLPERWEEVTKSEGDYI